MQNLSSQKLFLGLAALAGVGLLIYAFMAFRPQTEPQVLTPPPAPPVAVAKVPKKIGMVVYLKSLEPAANAFKQGLAEIGYVEGKDIVYIQEPTANDNKALPGIVQKYIDQKVDVIFAVPLEAALAAQKETINAGRTDIPIVFTSAGGALESGLIKEYKSSGNNTTGIVVDFVILTAKKLEFIQRIAPSAKKIGVFVGVQSDQAADLILAQLKEQAPKLGITFTEYSVQSPPGPAALTVIQGVADKIKSGEIDALFRLPGPVVSSPDAVKIQIALAKRLRIPLIGFGTNDTENGALFSYIQDSAAVGREVVPTADKVLKGVKPSDIPVQFHKKNVLIFNLKTAKEIGVTIPDSLLAIADKKIE